MSQFGRTIARVTAWASASHPPTVARAVAEMITTDRRDQRAAIQASVLLIASAMGAPGERPTQTVDRDKAQVSRARDVDVMAATQACHFVILDDPAFLHAELDRVLVPRAAARAGR
jgi:N-formylmaleamate deformylase